MSKILTPEELLNSQIEEFNRGNIRFLITLYEKDACFAFKAGQVVTDKEGIRQILQDLIDTGGKLKAKVKRVLNASNLALLITEWSEILNIEDELKRIFRQVIEMLQMQHCIDKESLQTFTS